MVAELRAPARAGLLLALRLRLALVQRALEAAPELRGGVRAHGVGVVLGRVGVLAELGLEVLAREPRVIASRLGPGVSDANVQVVDVRRRAVILVRDARLVAHAIRNDAVRIIVIVVVLVGPRRAAPVTPVRSGAHAADAVAHRLARVEARSEHGTVLAGALPHVVHLASLEPAAEVERSAELVAQRLFVGDRVGALPPAETILPLVELHETRAGAGVKRAAPLRVVKPGFVRGERGAVALGGLRLEPAPVLGARVRAVVLHEHLRV